MSALFPYVMEREPRSDWRAEPRIEPVANKHWFEQRKRYPDHSTLTTGSFPKGVSIAPFIWEYLGAEIPMQFLGGFVGVAQDPNTRVIRPAMGWAVRDAPASSPADS